MKSLLQKILRWLGYVQFEEVKRLEERRDELVQQSASFAKQCDEANERWRLSALERERIKREHGRMSSNLDKSIARVVELEDDLAAAVELNEKLMKADINLGAKRYSQNVNANKVLVIVQFTLDQMRFDLKAKDAIKLVLAERVAKHCVRMAEEQGIWSFGALELPEVSDEQPRLGSKQFRDEFGVVHELE